MDVSKAVAELKKLAQNCNEVVRDLKSGRLVQKMAEEAATAIYEDIDVIFNQGIKEWYDAYDPHYYTRTHSFYDMFNIYKKGSYIGWKIQDTVPGSHRVSGDYIFTYMWEGGFHGGAKSGKEDSIGQPFPGPMALRTPVPWRSDGGKPYRFWSKMKAEQTTSPSNLIGKNILFYQNNKGNYSGNTLSRRIDDAWEYVFLQYELFLNWR